MPPANSVYRDIFILSTPFIVICWYVIGIVALTYGGRGYTFDYAGLTGYESMGVLGGLFGFWFGAVLGHALVGFKKVKLQAAGYLGGSVSAFICLTYLFSFVPIQASYLWYFVAFILVAAVHFLYRYFSELRV